LHDQIVFGLYTTLINLSPVAYRERTKQKKKKKESGVQAIITTPLRRRRESFEQVMKEPSITGILNSSGFGSRRLPSHPSSGRCCIRTQQLQLGLQLGEVRQDTGQRQSAPLMDPIDGRCSNMTFDQLCRCGQCHRQGRCLIRPSQHWAPTPGG
jgi:hypothetical protein